MEYTVAKDSGSTIIAKREGVVDQLDANRIVIRVTDKKDTSLNKIDIYNLLNSFPEKINQEKIIHLLCKLVAFD